jgi:hypothetical protein
MIHQCPCSDRLRAGGFVGFAHSSLSGPHVIGNAVDSAASQDTSCPPLGCH